MMIKHSGNFNKTEVFLKRNLATDIQRALNTYGSQGVAALSAATPVDTGETKNSWGFTTKIEKTKCSITWTNSNISQGSSVPVVILLQYGHGTRSGVYIEGRDFINPAIKPIFDKIAEAVWMEVIKT